MAITDEFLVISSVLFLFLLIAFLTDLHYNDKQKAFLLRSGARSGYI